MIAIAPHTQHAVVSMFELSGVLLRPTANCTDACILQRSFQQAFGADGGKDEAPKCKYVLLESCPSGPYYESTSAAAKSHLFRIHWN